MTTLRFFETMSEKEIQEHAEILYSIARPKNQFDRWSVEEKVALQELVKKNGRKWKLIQKAWPTHLRSRSSEECRHRWDRLSKEIEKYLS